MYKVLATGLATLAALCSYTGFAAETISIEVKPGIGHTYLMSRNDGEASLHNLAENSAAEDFWIYNNGTFLDIGSSEELRKVVVDLDAMLTFAKSQLAQDRSFTIYHIHPLNADEEPELAPPGALDLYLHAITKKEFRKMNAPLISKVFDGFGLWEYDVSSKLETKLISANPKSKRSYILQLDAKDDLLRNKSILNKNIPWNQGIERYIGLMKNLGVLLKYTPLNQQYSK